MNSEPQKVQRSRLIPVAIGVAIPTLFFFFRFTAAVAFLFFVLLYIFYWLHRSRRALQVAFALFIAAILIPVDVYVPGFNGPLEHSEHSGLRFVRVLYGLGVHRIDGGEFISGGCIVGPNNTKWRLVWD